MAAPRTGFPGFRCIPASAQSLSRGSFPWRKTDLSPLASGKKAAGFAILFPWLNWFDWVKKRARNSPSSTHAGRPEGSLLVWAVSFLVWPQRNNHFPNAVRHNLIVFTETRSPSLKRHPLKGNQRQIVQESGGYSLPAKTNDPMPPVCSIDPRVCEAAARPHTH